MKAARNISLLCLLVMCLSATSGCSKKKDADVETDAKIDASKPVSAVKAEAEKMDAEQLRAVALKYKEAFESKSAELEELAKDLMKATISNAPSEQRDKLNAQMGEMSKHVNGLGEHFKIYREKLEEKGGDLSGLDL